MLPDPLHPAVVHFPVVLMILLPLIAIGAWWAIRRGASPARAWLFPVAGAAALALGSWAAVETGESEEERVEDVVAEQRLHQHEEAGERFLGLSAALFVLTAAGLARGGIGRAARGAATVGALALVAVGVQVGHSGGNLVYRYGAASAYTGADSQVGVASEGGSERERGEDED